MMYLIGLISAAVSAFFMALAMFKSAANAKALKAAGKAAKEYDKIDSKKDNRSDIDVLRRR